ncbi:DUF4296 domain-containing protein [Chishuiella sp.]|uniref:DUF4296 domain-containing protein n=1 Tax=Chishuiella sp. TaxID=1969467 RepID=UPI0028AEFEB9|nr:DUF4296 domain-containing protein [Chishuiella sp.]
MRYLNIVYFFCLISTLSCAPKNFDEPDNLIKKSEMINIITDLYISQQGIQMFPAEGNEDQSTLLAKDAVDVMKKHDINFHQFSESYKYYSLQPELLRDMLDQVKKNLEEKLSKEEKERIKNQKNIK